MECEELRYFIFISAAHLFFCQLMEKIEFFGACRAARHTWAFALVQRTNTKMYASYLLRRRWRTRTSFWQRLFSSWFHVRLKPFLALIRDCYTFWIITNYIVLLILTVGEFWIFKNGRRRGSRRFRDHRLWPYARLRLGVQKKENDQRRSNLWHVGRERLGWWWKIEWIFGEKKERLF